LSAVAALVLTNYTQICLEKEKQTGESPYDALTRVFALWTAGPSDAYPETGKKKRDKTRNTKKTARG